MLEEKTPKHVAEMEAKLEKEVITINRLQFVRAVADAVTDEPIKDIVCDNPMMVMLFSVVQRAIWDKCVKLTTSTEATDKKNKEDIEYGKIWSE